MNEVEVFGNGKRAEITIRLADGRRVEFMIANVRLVLCEGMVVESSRWDDVSRVLRVAGPDVSIHKGSVGWPGNKEDDISEIAAQLSEGAPLEYVVDVELELNKRGSHHKAPL
ncbi:MAG TPA: hypothetical protein VF062_12805 [Candidatus Limnocylindrales bacterium]